MAINPESGLTLTNSFEIGYGILSSDINRSTPVVFACDITGLVASEGMIHEQGAVGSGSWIGFNSSGDLLARCGDGGSLPRDDAAYGTASGISGDGTLAYEFGVSPVNSVRVWWNGVLVIDAVALDPGQWSGTNQGEYLSASSSVTSGQTGTPATYTTASPLRYYEDQLVTATEPAGTAVEALNGSVFITGQQCVVGAVAASNHVVIYASSGGMSTAGSAGYVSASASVEVYAASGSLAVPGGVGSVSASDHIAVQSNAGSVVTTGSVPFVGVGDAQTISATSGAMSLVGSNPSVLRSNHIGVFASSGEVSVSGSDTSVGISGSSRASSGDVSAAGSQPSVALTTGVTILAGSGSSDIRGHNGNATATRNVKIHEGAGVISISGGVGVAGTSVEIGAQAGNIVIIGSQARVAQFVSDPTPANRIYLVPSESRSVVVISEYREDAITSELRTFVV